MTHKEQAVSRRQVDVLVLLAQDGTYKDISAHLGVSEAAVDYHVRNLKRLFRTRTLAGLVTAAIGYGILSATSLPAQATGKLVLTILAGDT